MLSAVAVKFLTEIVEVAGEIIAATAEMLAERLFGKFRGQALREPEGLGEPAKAALVSEIEMQPKPAVAGVRSGLKVGLREGRRISICAKVKGADEARYGLRWEAYCSTGSSKVMRRIWVSSPSMPKSESDMTIISVGDMTATPSI